MIFINTNDFNGRNRDRRVVPARRQAPGSRVQTQATQETYRLRLLGLPYRARRDRPISKLKSFQLDKLVEQQLSVLFIVLHSTFIILCSIALIVLGIVGLLVNYKSNYSGSGIW